MILIVAQQNIVWNGGEFIHDALGTYDLALFAIGFICELGGLFLSALGKITVTGENKNTLPTPNPSAFTFVFSSRKSRLLGTFIIVTLIMRVFGWQLSNVTYLILFSFGVGFFGYLLVDPMLNYVGGYVKKVLPGFNVPGVPDSQPSTNAVTQTEQDSLNPHQSQPIPSPNTDTKP